MIGKIWIDRRPFLLRPRKNVGHGWENFGLDGAMLDELPVHGQMRTFRFWLDPEGGHWQEDDVRDVDVAAGRHP